MRDAIHVTRPDGVKRIVERVIFALMLATPIAMIAFT
jgi:hypothetical protein